MLIDVDGFLVIDVDGCGDDASISNSGVWGGDGDGGTWRLICIVIVRLLSWIRLYLVVHAS